MPSPVTGQHREGAEPGRGVAERTSREAAPRRIDSGNPASVSFEREGGIDPGAVEWSYAPAPGRGGHARVGVGPGFPGEMLLGSPVGLLGMNPFPIVGARIHPPLLRADTLSRERLNGWLDEAATGRVALIVAEAGFGKTTLLGDWARNSPRLTAWYRLDPDDRDWLTFTRHLVASGRELDPGFAPDTYALLLQLGPGGPTRADILASLVREYADFGVAHPQGLTLIFDDYHAVDGSDEVVPTVRALIEQTGPGFSIVIASRSTPSLPLGRLRARGAVSRIGADALCFDVPETDRLFRDAYHLSIEHELVDELVHRTEGWAALLSLVNTNLGEQVEPDPRALVTQLSATRGDLYDFLAEEVVSALDPELHTFLMRVSVLARIDIGLAGLVYRGSRAEIVRAIEDSEKLGLLSRPDRDSPHRFHSLVRDFLLSQLAADIGHQAVANLHVELGRQLETADWAMSAEHYRAGGDPTSASRVVDGAIPEIFALGQFERARSLLDGSAGAVDRPGALILRSRLELSRGNFARALELAREAVEDGREEILAGQSLLNLSSLLGFSGYEDVAVDYAEQAIDAGLPPGQLRIAHASIAMWQAQREGDLAAIASGLLDLAIEQDAAGHQRYAGITRVNLSSVLVWRGDATGALEAAATAQINLGGRSAGSAEYVAATAAEATALAVLGRLDEATALLGSSADVPSALGRDEALIEKAKILTDYGDLGEARIAIDMVSEPESHRVGGLWALIRGQIAIRESDLETASAMINRLRETPCRDICGQLRSQLLVARVAVRQESTRAHLAVRELARVATAQRSRPGILLANLLSAAEGNESIDAAIDRLQGAETHLLSVVAEEIVARLDLLSPRAIACVELEAQARPSRWRTPMRSAVDGKEVAKVMAATLLAGIGSFDDAAFLRSVAKGVKPLRPAAMSITHRLAPKIQILDLGVVHVSIGGVPLEKRIRRKVLGLLCFVACRPGFAATRDEALEALWSDLSPDTAVNSLHQTIYFLRRLFEPDYSEGMSAGYVQFDGDVLSLDTSLVETSSRRCWALLSDWSAGNSTAIDRLLDEYTGKFALDFAYEDWATAYRDNLHAAVLAAAETEIGDRLDHGRIEEAIALAQRVLAIDPMADSIELRLLRAYKRGGRLAAAAEQYAHYATMVRDELGAEPPPYSDI